MLIIFYFLFKFFIPYILIKFFALPQFLPYPSPTLNPPKFILFLSLKKTKTKQTSNNNNNNKHIEYSSQNGDVFIKPLKTQDTMWKRIQILRAKVVGDSKETEFSDTAELTQIWSQRDRDGLYRTYTDHGLKPNKCQYREKEMGTKSHLQPRSHSQLIANCEREKHFLQ